MAGNAVGGRKARDTNLKNDPDFYKKLGKLGAEATAGRGGFGSEKVGKDGLTGRERASKAAKLGWAKRKK